MFPIKRSKVITKLDTMSDDIVSSMIETSCDPYADIDMDSRRCSQNDVESSNQVSLMKPMKQDTFAGNSHEIN